MPLQKNKRKVVRMKPKGRQQKEAKDYISETISFVIKGKLTPIKPTFVAKKVGVGRKAGPKKKETKRKVAMRKGKNEGAKPKTPKKAKKKTPAKETKKVNKRVDKVKTDEDIKTKQTIEKLLKQANKALKTPKKSKVKEEPQKGKKPGPKKRKKEVSEEAVKVEPEAKKAKIKSEPASDEEVKPRKKLKAKPSLFLAKKRKEQKEAPQRGRKTKLFGFWSGPRRRRVASLNAIAKVHCLYENETRGGLPEAAAAAKPRAAKTTCTRTLRSVPGLRAVGRHWDMHDTTTSSSEESCPEMEAQRTRPEPRRRRNRAELVMDLKDMVVRKRMASLNASAILAASYSVEKRASRSPRSGSEEIDSSDYFVTDGEEQEAERRVEGEEGKLTEVRATPNKKVAVILNQDTDVTITGVYVNSTTRSTHHEGYCSIAGMQYRISATSHTQTAATAVATETLLQSSSSSTQDNSNSESLTSCKSYTPLDALSNMQPPPGPGIQHTVPHQHMGPPQHVLPHSQHQLSPNRRHGCASAFSAPHGPPPYPPSHHQPPLPGEPGYVHGYYQPAGPLISVSHGHAQQQPPPPPPPPPVTKSVPLSDTSPTSASPLHQPPPPPSSNGDSSDSEVIITSVTAGKEAVPPPPQPTYRYPQYPATPPGYAYGYPPHYYPTPQPPAPPSYAHHDLCYTASPYLHHKYPPPQATAYRRYLPGTQYFPSPPDIYTTPPPGPAQQNQQVVTTTPVTASGSSYQPPPTGPPQAIMETYPLVETYPHPPHYYPGYAPAPPSCYTHPPTTRTLPYINPTYQSCPCPMQSCPKNVHTGPLTGDSKRSNISIAKDSMPLPPVALALPLEPASATGPPSPARGSAGMPPPPSPAGATYQPPPPAPKHEEANECNPVEKKRKARVGKAMVRNNIAAIQQNTMLLMCNPGQRSFPGEVKREIESPREKIAEAKKEISSDDELKASELIKLQSPLEPPMDRIPEPQKLKKEESCDEKEEKIAEETLPKKEEVQVCVNTVAENVKMKNMKRKLSVSTEKKPEPEVDPKKVKLEAKYPNGSYKDLIRKDTTAVKINNGKRKLIEEEDGEVATKTKKRTKRKLSSTKDEETSSPTKRPKQTRPLSVSNQQHSKQYPKEKSKSEPVLSENKEPPKKATKKVKTVDGERTNNASDKCAKGVKEQRKGANKVGVKECCGKGVVTRRRSKEATVQQITRVSRRLLHLPRWSNGWTWEGEAYESNVFLNSDETTVVRKCYPAMRHDEGDTIEVRDCVLLKAGPRKNDLPFVAKIAYLWDNPDDGEMMMSLLWYYRPEHTEQGRLPADQPDEVFASRHKDSNSVACIDDKCYVLTFHEYCRYRKDLRRLEEGIEETSPCIPNPEQYPRYHRQPPSPLQVSSDMVFFCRRVYDFRQKRIVKNPS